MENLGETLFGFELALFLEVPKKLERINSLHEPIGRVNLDTHSVSTLFGISWGRLCKKFEDPMQSSRTR